MSKRPKLTMVSALRRYRNECREEGDLGIECALATLAIYAAHVERAYTDNSFSEVMGSLGTLMKQVRNVRKALEIEFADMNWLLDPITTPGIPARSQGTSDATISDGSADHGEAVAPGVDQPRS